jgi:hypothetical protein
LKLLTKHLLLNKEETSKSHHGRHNFVILPTFTSQ